MISQQVPDLDAHDWCHDDGIVVGELDDPGAVVDTILTEGPLGMVFLNCSNRYPIPHLHARYPA